MCVRKVTRNTLYAVASMDCPIVQLNEIEVDHVSFNVWYISASCQVSLPVYYKAYGNHNHLEYSYNKIR